MLVYDPEDKTRVEVNAQDALMYGESLLYILRGDNHDLATLDYLAGILTQLERTIGIERHHFLRHHLMSEHAECWCITTAYAESKLDAVMAMAAETNSH